MQGVILHVLFAATGGEPGGASQLAGLTQLDLWDFFFFQDQFHVPGQIQPDIVSLKAPARERPGQFPIPAAQVEDFGRFGQLLQDAPGAGLQSHPVGGKLDREGLVKLTVE